MREGLSELRLLGTDSSNSRLLPNEVKIRPDHSEILNESEVAPNRPLIDSSIGQDNSLRSEFLEHKFAFSQMEVAEKSMGSGRNTSNKVIKVQAHCEEILEDSELRLRESLP